MTANDRFTTEAEQAFKDMTAKNLLRRILVNPLVLNFQEPIVLVLNLYMALIYALLFAALESFKLIYVGIYGFSSGEEGLTFIAVLLSFEVGVAFYFLFLFYYHEGKFDAHGKLPPEQRLIPAFVTAFTLPIGLFWYGWSAHTSIHWIMPVIGGSFLGIASCGVFASILNYLPEAYPSVASTVLAGMFCIKRLTFDVPHADESVGNCFLRSSVAGLFPISIPALYKAVGPGWASSIWGFIGCIFLPAPFVLYRYGSIIRGKSKNARKDF